MAASTSGTEWLEYLDKQFDLAYTDLGLLLEEIADDQYHIIQEGHVKMSVLSSSFRELALNAQAMFEDNALLKQELLKLKSDLSESQGCARTATRKETKQMVLQYSQLETVEDVGKSESTRTFRKNMYLEMENNTFDENVEGISKSEMLQLKQENVRLKQDNADLCIELRGAKFFIRYLEKELAGRIQQVQLLYRDLKPDDYERLWNDLESEIRLHRHKTVIRACRASEGSAPAYPPDHNRASLRSSQGIGKVRTVVIERECADDGVGISITGGAEHGVPILIWKIYSDLPAGRKGELYVGDAVLSVNGIDLRNATCEKAFRILSNQLGNLVLEVCYVVPDDDDYEEEDVGKCISGNHLEGSGAQNTVRERRSIEGSLLSNLLRTTLTGSPVGSRQSQEECEVFKSDGGCASAGDASIAKRDDL